MAPTVMARLCPGHRYLGVARLDGYRLAFTRRSVRTGSGVADIVGAPGSTVWGVVYEIGEEDLAALDRKERAHRLVQATERIWDFYFELFGQRQGKYGNWLLSCDRIAMDCYQAAYTGLGVARTVPAPPPFCYMKTGFAPATIRRGMRMRRLGKQMNPFPLVQLPYHRLVNPWTLGAVMHEVSHNLQNDLGLNKDIPRQVGLQLLKAGLGRSVSSVWVRWNREMFADITCT